MVKAAVTLRPEPGMVTTVWGWRLTLLAHRGKATKPLNFLRRQDTSFLQERILIKKEIGMSSW